MSVISEDFDVVIEAELVQWAEQPIVANAHLSYVGDAPTVTVYGPASGIATVSIQNENESVYLGGRFPSSECVAYTLVRGAPVDIPLTGDPELRLTPGDWDVEIDGWLWSTKPADCAVDGDGQAAQLLGHRHVLVTPFEPVARASVCSNDFSQPDAAGPHSLTIDGHLQAGLTMQSGWAWRDGRGGGDVDYGAWEVDLPDEVVGARRGDAVMVEIGAGFQLHRGEANRYSAERFLVEGSTRVNTGRVLGHPTVAVADGSALELVAPMERGRWVIQLTVGWLSPCLISGGEVNFRLETR